MVKGLRGLVANPLFLLVLSLPALFWVFYVFVGSPLSPDFGPGCWVRLIAEL